MTSRDLVNTCIQSFPRDAALKVDGEEPIVTAGNYVSRDIGPRLEAARFGEQRFRLVALASLALCDDFGRKVVQEVRGRVEVRRVPAPASGGGPGGGRSRISPPVSGALSRHGNHGVDEDQ